MEENKILGEHSDLFQIIKDTMIALYACRVRSCKYVVFIIHFALCKNITF